MSSAIEGKKVLVTRPKQKGGKLVRKLEELGAVPLHMPVTEIVDPRDLQPLDCALSRLHEFDWLVFTSSNGVEAVSRRLGLKGLSLRDFPELKIAVVGPATAESLSEHGRTPDAIPAKFLSEEISRIIPNLSQTRILLTRGDLASIELPQTLASAGATVVDVVAYRIVARSGMTEFDRRVRPDVITVMSGESARATMEQLRECGLDDWLQTVPIACIGPVTAATVERARIHPSVVAEEHTVEGLVQSLEKFFGMESIPA